MIQDAADAVWREIAYDVLTMVQEQEGKDSIPRSHVIELVCDAGRLEDRITDGDLRTKLDAAFRQGQYPYVQRILRESFRCASYGI